MTTPLDQINAARVVLTVAKARPSIMATLGAATLAATAAVLLAGVMVLGPGSALEDPAVVAAAL